MKRRRLTVLLLAALLLVSVVAFGAYKRWYEKPTQSQIDQAIEEKDYGRIASLLERSDLSEDNGYLYFNLGVAYTELGNRSEAILAFMKSDDRGYLRPNVRHRIAAHYANQGDDRLAMQWLSDALEVGFDADLIEDGALTDLVSSSGWRDFYYGGEGSQARSESSLDFLLGIWSIGRNGFSGNQTVTFTKTMRGLITEEWQPNSASSATGVFQYLPRPDEWHYAYVDSFGRVFEGDVRTSKRLVTVSGLLKYLDGTEILRRIEIRASSGVVDYVVYDSRDNGRTWDDEDRRRLTIQTDLGQPAF